jgi:hypothetical protein
MQVPARTCFPIYYHDDHMVSTYIIVLTLLGIATQHLADSLNITIVRFCDRSGLLVLSDTSRPHDPHRAKHTPLSSA